MLRGSVPSATQHNFSRAPQVGVPRSKFSRPYNVKTTFNAGKLVPILADEMLPGDTFALKMHAFARIATLINPIMDNLYLETFFFFVPNRLVWSNWEKFCGYQVNPGDSVDFTIPQQACPAGGYQTGSLGDYFGLPTLINNMDYPNALHFRAYNLIWNEWFRDQDLQNSVTVDTTDGPDNAGNYVLLNRNKRHDYFTSCRPFPQKGPDVELPLGTSAPITRVSNATGWFAYETGTNNPAAASVTFGTPPAAPAGAVVANPGGIGISFDPEGQIITDLSTATGANINDLRLAFQTQRFYEKQARGGTRYTEVIKSHFDVQSPDMRLQRPEYIGGGSTPVIINPIAQTSQTSGTNALGNLGAYGVCAPNAHGFTYSATEHGVILGLVSVRADLTYQQGMDRMWSRQTFTDYYWPVFSHLGEQAVLNREIYAQGIPIDDEVFGYQERYAEYRYKNSLVTGLFRSNAAGSLDSWHLAQEFGALPTLNSAFIQENPPMSRVEAVPSGYDFLFDATFVYHCTRPMPLYSVPGLIDHF